MPEHRASGDGLRYWAFITYSHRDARWCNWLHRSLETFRVPKHLVGRLNGDVSLPKRLYPVFRDREELGSAADLGELIRAALDKSRNLIVVCSPHAARSRWVNEEITYFKSLGRSDRVFCLIVDGEPYASRNPESGLEECFPEALRFGIDENGETGPEPVEPLAADARPGKDGRKGALLKLLSGILNVGFDALRQRDAERRVRLLVMTSAASVILALLMGFLATFALTGQREAIRTQSDLLMNGAMFQAEKGQTHLAVAGLARAVALNEDNDTALARLVSLLTQRVFPIELGRFHLHEGRIAWVEPSHAGNVLLTASFDGSLSLFDIARESVIGRLSANGVAYEVADFSDDDRLVAVGAESGELRIFGTEDFVERAKYSLDGRLLDVRMVGDLCRALVITDDGTLSLRRLSWGSDVTPGEPKLAGAVHSDRVIPVSDIPGITAAAVGGGADRVVAATDQGVVAVWDITDTSVARSGYWNDHDGAASRVALSPDELLVASVGQNGKLVIRDIENSGLLVDGVSLSGASSVLRFSRDSRYLVAATTRGDSFVWDRVTRSRLPVTARHDGTISDAVLAADGQGLLTASWDGTARYSTVHEDWPTKEPMRHRSSVYSVLAGPDVNQILTGGEDGDLRHWKYFSSRFVFQDMDLGGRTALISQSRAGDVLAASSGSDRVLLMSMKGPGTVTQMLGFDHPVVGVDVSEGGEFALLAESNGVAHIWSAVAGEVIRSIRIPTALSGLMLLPDGRSVLATTPNRQMRVWDLDNGNPMTVPMTHPGGILHTLVAPRQHLLIAAGHDRTVRLWDLRTGLPYRENIMFDETINQVVFDADAERLYVAAGNTVHVYGDLPESREIGRFVHPQRVWSLGINPADGKVASACLDGVARVWRIDGWDSPEHELRHKNAVVSAGFSRDGRYLVTGTFDGGVYVWDADRGLQVADPVHHRDGVMWVRFDGDARRVTSASFDGQIKVTEMGLHLAAPAPQWLPEFAEHLGGWRYDDTGQISDNSSERALAASGRAGGGSWGEWRKMVAAQNFGESR